MPASLSRTRVPSVVALMVAMTMTTASLVAPLPAHADDPSDRLLTGQTLDPGDRLQAVGSQHVLTVQANGDVVLRDGHHPIWHTRTAGHSGARVTQHPDGSMAVQARDGRTLWTTEVRSPGARTVVKPDGVLYTINTAGKVAWKHLTSAQQKPADRLPHGGILLSGETIASPEGAVTMTMQPDGNLTVRDAHRLLWQTATTSPGARAEMNSQGRLEVISRQGRSLWVSDNASPADRLVIKDHGRAYLIDRAGASLWGTPATPAERVPAVVNLPLPDALPVLAPRPPLSGDGTTPAHGADAPEQARPATYLLDAPQYQDPSSPAALAARAARSDGRHSVADALDAAAAGGTARWLVPQDTTSSVASTVRTYATRAAQSGQTPVFVTYAIPDRDCGNHSAGGMSTPVEYQRWTEQIARGLHGQRAVVIVEPDALLHLNKCGNSEQRTKLLRSAVLTLADAGAEVYIDAASSNSFGWSHATLTDMAHRLRAAGVDAAAGFAVNTSNFQRTQHEVAYGNYLSALLGGPAFVIDTSRNGNGPLAGADGTVWCNPPGRALGSRPAVVLDGPHVANLWIKTVGLSDGSCNGGPPAGQFWEAYLLEQATAR